ncbi:hypothetical protein [Nonomuraea sp. NPDC049400]|uniref:hypothetical protein n=1 Tax=Nonomuraea sp. NPDC049400 TaxID=3364352 RepID=UPI0037AB7199
MHPGPLDRLTSLYAEWARIYAADSELPRISFYDALDRHANNLGLPRRLPPPQPRRVTRRRTHVEFDT